MESTEASSSSGGKGKGKGRDTVGQMKKEDAELLVSLHIYGPRARGELTGCLAFIGILQTQLTGLDKEEVEKLFAQGTAGQGESANGLEAACKAYLHPESTIANGASQPTAVQ